MYKILSPSLIIRVSDGAFIPVDSGNRDYEEYLLWVENGGAAMPADNKQPSRDDVEKMRLHAYADPINGSDRHFNEAIRMQAMGESGWNEVRQRGISRFEEIQLQYPWPA